MNDISTIRRLVLAATGIAVAGFLTRSQIADALVLRGDEALYRARPVAALPYYGRALWFDPNDGNAVDRYAFVALAAREPRAVRDGIAIASAYLRRRPNDEIVRMDRAMAYRLSGNASRALADFAIVGARTQDPRALTFAGYEARAIGDTKRARRFWRRALALDPHLPAAKHALERTGEVR